MRPSWHSLDSTQPRVSSNTSNGPHVQARAAHAAAQGTPQQVCQSSDPLVYQYVNALADGPVRFHYPGPTIFEDFGLGTVPVQGREHRRSAP